MAKYVKKGGNGGKRAGSGRPAGAKDRARLALEKRYEHLQGIILNGQDLPLDFLLKVMRDEEAPFSERKECAIEALPYCHVKLVGHITNNPGGGGDQQNVRSIEYSYIQPSWSEAEAGSAQQVPAPGGNAD